MRSKNKALMDKICDFVNDYYKMYRKSPYPDKVIKVKQLVVQGVAVNVIKKL